MFHMDLSTNNDYFLIPNSVIGFYNLDTVCLLRGTEYAFKCMCNSVYFFLPYRFDNGRTFIIVFVNTIYWEVTYNTCLKYTILPSVSLSRVSRC
jgi:hypothetical protein